MEIASFEIKGDEGLLKQLAQIEQDQGWSGDLKMVLDDTGSFTRVAFCN